MTSDDKPNKRFALAHYRDVKRHGWNRTCPACGKQEFSPYIDIYKGVPIDDKTCGRCNRETHCAYHKPPREWFYEHRSERREWLPREEYIARKRQERKESFEARRRYEEEQRKRPRFDPHAGEQHPDVQAYLDQMSEWCQQWQSAANALATYLYSLAPHEQVDAMLARYRTGSTHDGRIIYWLIDQHGRVRTGKFMRYGPDGHRLKDQAGAINWVHAVKGLEQLADQCLFGEHLLMDHTGTIALVESEKTALILAIKYPHILWIATGGKKGFMHDRLWPLCGREVYVLPDADALDEWTQKAEGFNREHGYRLIVPDEYRTMCTPQAREHKWDLADMLLADNR